MRLPRKAILIRLCIYIPLLAFFGWQAYQRYRSEQAAEREAPEIDGVKRVIMGPDGKPIEYFEITEEQARKMGYEPGQAPAAKAVDAKGDAKAPAPAAPGAN